MNPQLATNKPVQSKNSIRAQHRSLSPLVSMMLIKYQRKQEVKYTKGEKISKNTAIDLKHKAIT